MHPDHRHAEHQFPQVRAAWGIVAHLTSNVSHENLSVAFRRLLRPDGERALRSRNGLKASYNLSESGHDAQVSLLTGKAMSHKANITASKSYSPHHDLRFDVKDFMELRSVQSVTIAYDGTNPMPPTFCYLKPYYNDVNKSYFRQLADGEL